MSTNGSTPPSPRATTTVPDAKPVTPAQIRGTVWYSVPLLGYVNNTVNGPGRGWVTGGSHRPVRLRRIHGGRRGACRPGENAGGISPNRAAPARHYAGQLTRSSCQGDSPRLDCRESNKTFYGSNGHPGVALGAGRTRDQPAVVVAHSHPSVLRRPLSGEWAKSAPTRSICSAPSNQPDWKSSPATRTSSPGQRAAGRFARVPRAATLVPVPLGDARQRSGTSRRNSASPPRFRSTPAASASSPATT